MSTGKLFTGIVAGVASGILLGILYAPDKGVVTRKKMFSKRQVAEDDSTKRFDEFVESISGKFNAVKENEDATATKQKEKSYSRMTEIKGDT